MTKQKLKVEVRVNDDEGAGDIELELSPEQSVKLLEYVMEGSTIHINLTTPSTTRTVRAIDNPQAYAS